MKFEEIEIKLQTQLSAKRYAHVVGVCKTAEAMAKHYGVDANQARLAGLLHDCAREFSTDRLLQLAQSFGIVVNVADPAELAVLHAKIGAKLAAANYGIEDPLVCQAIACHTSGAPQMNVLDKIVYLADSIEPNRKYEGIETLREVARKNLNQATLMALDRSVSYLLQKKAAIHLDTIKARNELLQQMY